MYNMNWTEQLKNGLHMETFLHRSAALFQQWLVRTVTGINEVLLVFLEEGQRERVVDEQNLQQAALEDD